jgi:hypothetical protein
MLAKSKTGLVGPVSSSVELDAVTSPRGANWQQGFSGQFDQKCHRYLVPAKNHRRREEHAFASASALPMRDLVQMF